MNRAMRLRDQASFLFFWSCCIGGEAETHLFFFAALVLPQIGFDPPKMQLPGSQIYVYDEIMAATGPPPPRGLGAP